MAKAHTLKARKVKNLAEEIKNSKTLMVVSIKGLPSRQFQEIKKYLRKDVKIKVEKKNILVRSIKEIKKELILPLEKDIKENCAFALSNLEGFELASLLSKKRTPVFAKAGQIALNDIEVKEGPTDLVPGPAISELGALGIQIAVENGKIAIKKDKVILKEGNIIKENAASVLQKLGIQPFSVGLEVLSFYDVSEEKIYSNVKVNTEETIQELQLAKAKALGFAQKIMYYCKETIGYFLAKANAEANTINSKLNPEETA